MALAPPHRPQPPIPPDEDRRLATLRATGLLDSPPEDAFDDVVALAARLLNAPAALINLVDADRQWAKAAVGDRHGNEVPRTDSFCAHTVADPSQPLVVEDASRDPRFSSNPLVTDGGLRFYAGVPLTTREGLALGALCVTDDHARTLSPDDLKTLETLAAAATAQIELRRGQAAARRVAIELRDLFDRAPDAVVQMDAAGRITEWNDRATELFGWERDEALGMSVGGLLVPPSLRDQHFAGVGAYLAGGPAHILGEAVELPALHRHGHEVPVELTVSQLGDRTLDPDEIRFVAFVRDASARHALDREREAERRNVATIASVARRLARATVVTEVENEICAAVQDVTRADGVQLWRPHPEGGLVAGAAVGAPTGLRVTTGEPSCSIAVIESGERIFVPDVHAEERISPRMATVLGAASAVFVPVHAGESPIAVLAVFWRTPMSALGAHTDALLELLSAEAAVALERTGLIARLETLSRTDALTGLANRRMLDDEIAREVARAQRADEPLSVVMLDLDHFKAFNDEHGHQSGDRLLKETSSAWRSLMRASDLLARYGGEEFVLVLPDCPGHEALALAARLRDAMPLQQSCSAGVAQLREGESAAELIARADRLLYAAKAAGRDCAVIDED